MPFELVEEGGVISKEAGEGDDALYMSCHNDDAVAALPPLPNLKTFDKMTGVSGRAARRRRQNGSRLAAFLSLDHSCLERSPNHHDGKL